jgi:hypothetical protein
MVATSWLLLFLAHASLVSAGRTDLHRRLGVAGVVIAALFVVVGYATAVTAARLGVTPPGGPPPLAFLAVPIVTLLSFAVFAALGLSWPRADRETHKRLMPLATIAIPLRHRLSGVRSGGARAGAPRLSLGRDAPHALASGSLRAHPDGGVALGREVADQVK